MFRRNADTDLLRRGDRVIAVRGTSDFAEGALGTVKMAVGQAWTRYLVKWDTGEWVGTVDGRDIVRQDRLELYHARQAEAAARAAQAAAAKPVESATAESGGGGDSRVPEHLLARSRAARERWAAKAAS